MNLTNEIKNFLNNDSILKDFDDKKLIKSPLKFDNGYGVFLLNFNLYVSNDNLLYLFSVNKENEIIHINHEYLLRKYLSEQQINLIIENIEEDAICKINEKYNNLLPKIYENIKEELDRRQPEYDKKYEYEKCKKDGMKLYAQNNKNNEITIYHEYDQINLDFISAYNTSDFKDYCKTLITKKMEDLYIKDYFSIKAFNDYKKELESNPFMLKETKIREILLNDDYKSFRIYHTLPSGSQKEFIFKKDLVKYKDVNKQIIEKSQIYNIPIKAIDKIIFRKTVLYDSKDYDVPEYDNEELALEYAKCEQDTMIEEIIPYFNMEPEVMKYVFEVNNNLFERFDEDLKKDPDFLLDLLENHNIDRSYRYSWYRRSFNSVLEYIPDDLFSDKNFVNKLIEFFKRDHELEEPKITTHIINTQFLENVDYSILTEQNIIDLLNRYSTDILMNTIIKKDVSHITENIVECAIKNHENKKFTVARHSPDLEKITDIKILTSLFTMQSLANNMCYINESILDDRDFVINLLNEETANPFYGPATKSEGISVVFDKYKNDKNILHMMIPFVQNSSLAQSILYDLNENDDKDAIYDYASLSVCFLDFLKSDSEYELYLEAETLEIDAMSIVPIYRYYTSYETTYQFKFHTYNGEIILEKGADARNVEGWNIFVEDAHEHHYKFDPKYNEIAIKNIKNFIEKEMGLDFKKLKPSYQNFKKMFINGKTEEEIKNFHFPPLPKEEIEK